MQLTVAQLTRITELAADFEAAPDDLVRLEADDEYVRVEIATDLGVGEYELDPDGDA